MYNRGDKGRTNHSANIVSDKVVAQIVAIDEQNDNLEENQYKIADTMQQIICGDTPIRVEDCIPFIIDMESVCTAPTENNTNLSSLMAQHYHQYNQALQVMQIAIKKLAAGGGNCRRKNYNSNSNIPTASTRKVVPVYCQWNKYCHSC